MQHLIVRGIKQTIQFTTAPPSPAKAGEGYLVNARSSAGFNVEYESATPSVCSAGSSETYFSASGTCTIVASARGDDEYEEGKGEQTFQVLKEQQHITFSPAPTTARIGGPRYAPSAVASSGLPVSLSIATPAICKLEEASEVAFVAAGTCTIDAKQAGSSFWEAAPQVEVSFQVSKALQHLSFQTVPASDVVLGEGAFPVSAVSSAGLPLELSSATPSTCSVEGGEVHLLAPGTCTIDASQAGNGEYEEATITRSFNIEKRSQVVRFTSSPPESVTVGGAPYLVAAESSSGLPVSFSTTEAAVCEAGGGTIHFIGPGACVIEATQQGDAEFQPAAARQSIRVNAAPLPILPGPPGGPLSAPFVSTPDSSFRLAKGSKLDRTTGAITFSVSVTQTGTLSWNVTFADGSFGVLAASRSKCRRNQVMLRGACRPRRLTFGTGTLEVGATAAASGNVSFTVAPSGAARSALQKALRLRRPLAVRAAISFQSAFGGSPVAHSYSIDDRLSSKRHVTAG